MPVWKRAVTASHIKSKPRQEDQSTNAPVGVGSGVSTRNEHDDDDTESGYDLEGENDDDDDVGEGGEREITENVANARGQKKREGKAGLPDCVLQISKEKGAQTAITEMKTSWGYTEELMQRIFTELPSQSNRGHPDRSPLPPNKPIKGTGGGWFDWRQETAEADLIKQVSTSTVKQLISGLHSTQIWGEIVFFNVKWGVWTNGQKIFAFVRTDTYKEDRRRSSNQLTISEFQDIHTPNIIHFGFMGLCFASLDERPEMRPSGGGAADTVTLLCPVSSRVVPRAHQ